MRGLVENMTSYDIEFAVSDEIGLSFLEQLQKSCLNDCQNLKRPFLHGVSEKEKFVILTRPNCKCWNCTSCASRNARRWIARIIEHVNHADTENGWFMFTLTAHEKWRGDYLSVLNLRRSWKKLYNRMRYEFGVSQYCKVWEMHADKTFHLHGLIDAVIETRWLKDNARSCGLGYQVDIHKVDNAGQVAGYIAKYFLKAQEQLDEKRQYPRNLRRIEVSRSWTPFLKLDAKKDLIWMIDNSREQQLRLANDYKNINYQVIDTVKC